MVANSASWAEKMVDLKVLRRADRTVLRLVEMKDIVMVAR